MTLAGWVQILLLVVVVTALTPLLGSYMARVYQGERLALSPLLGPLERLAYRVLRVSSDDEQSWKAYARSLILFSVLGWLALYAVLRTQGGHPLNPQKFDPGPWNLSFNTASSFVSNTSWQFYGGESTLSYFSQMVGITVASFSSGAAGMAVAVVLIRGIARRGTAMLGNFWVDVTRSTLYVLLPLSLVAALFLGLQGVPQTLRHYAGATGPGGASQLLALGPVASQESIKLLSGDGGGFFNVNSAMPFENPTALSNFVEMVLMLLIPAAFTATFGRMIGNRRQGWALYGAMIAMFVAGAAVLYAAEAHGTPAAQLAGVHGGNLEGKDLRFGVAGSSLFDTSGTASGDGAVNSALESLTGLGSAVPMANIMSGEVIFGGPGAGLYSMLLLVVLAVFIAGLMVGRTPAYLGKQIQMHEVKLAVVGALFVPMLVLVSGALALSTHAGRQSLAATGSQGYSETAYAYLSQSGNNGSALAGYTGFIQPVPGNAGSHAITFANLAGGLAMTFGRFVPILAVLALAGSLGPRRVAPLGPGTMRTDTPTFAVFLVSFVVIFAVLTFLVVLCLGPFAQALSAQLG
jgi:K+-transporting ATPase ATPase A chain